MVVRLLNTWYHHAYDVSSPSPSPPAATCLHFVFRRGFSNLSARRFGLSSINSFGDYVFTTFDDGIRLLTKKRKKTLLCTWYICM